MGVMGVIGSRELRDAGCEDRLAIAHTLLITHASRKRVAA